MVKIKSAFSKHWRSKIQQIKRPLQHMLSLADNQCQERGSVVVIVTLSLTVLLGFCAVVADMGLLYAQKAHLQNSVDAAALAGVQELLKGPSDATSMAIDYATKNGVADVNVSVEANNAIIVVQAKQQVPTYFARIWGITEEQISVSARAMLLPPMGLYGAVPLSIQEQDFVFGQKYILKSGGGSGTSEWYLDDDKNNSVKRYGEEYGTSGWYGALELSGTGANTYESDLANGYQGSLFVGQILNVKHGNMSGPTADGINTRINRDTRVPRNTIDNHDRNAPQIVYIPIVRIISESGNSIHEVQIVGFAAFFLEGVAGNGNESIVTGWFIRTLASNAHNKDHLSDSLKTEEEIENGAASNDYGLYTPKLIAN
ncbi:TadE/TadG family type IV pilus assembly protein [Desulfosporosinus lacus]|uniref:Putative Flp pilus-assembly TadE/G-like n=1 Tax=Desulfosporosinus lacus DSM 15449 TaxID=1121420 RepID=A0A1M5WBM3_9FIRM|nr:pilus assembly protein TadG-related protein [Desulfosporosinus lacus]SHH84905.1 Putative Flp pilus-assembly TadE/G-like [Desulfosporosinus lacus DSM 15449]